MWIVSILAFSLWLRAGHWTWFRRILGFPRRIKQLVKFAQEHDLENLTILLAAVPHRGISFRSFELLTPPEWFVVVWASGGHLHCYIVGSSAQWTWLIDGCHGARLHFNLKIVMAPAPVPGLLILGMFCVHPNWSFYFALANTVNPIYEFTVNMHDSLAFILTSLVSMTGQISVSGSSILLPRLYVLISTLLQASSSKVYLT
jgi:hypothetical protein